MIFSYIIVNFSPTSIISFTISTSFSSIFFFMDFKEFMHILFYIGLIVFCLYLILPIIYIAFFITRYLELMSNSCDVVFCMLIQSLYATYSLYVKFSKKVYQLNYFTKRFRKNLKTYWLLKEINL